MTSILLLALLGTVISLVIGTLWYLPATPMGKIHMKYIGFADLSPEEQQMKIAEAKPTMWKTYLGQAVISFLTSFAVVYIVSLSIQNGVSIMIALAFVALNWLCFMVPVAGSGVLWGRATGSVTWKEFISGSLSYLVTVVIIALVTSLFI